MEVFLLQTISTLGARGETVRVKPGYARNYLFPKKLAVPLSNANFKEFQEEEKRMKRRDAHATAAAQDLAARLVDVSCTVPVQVGEEDRLYGSVTTMDISNELKRQGFDIEKRQIELEEPIKKLGVYTVPLKLHGDVTAAIKVWVVKE
ncbi:MAG: 50S ribosomal protein L9 [Chitinivibrionia bacterium]|nr:50S ribosomal protein L9 [Chitinivibrionia bacterium]